MKHSDKVTKRVTRYILVLLFILVIRNFNTFSWSDNNYWPALEISKGSRSSNDNLVVFNAIGKRNNLALVEHARRNIFKPDTFDCIAFMFSKEDRIPDNNAFLISLQNELGCSISRTPGLMWGDFLQFISPTFVSNYDYVALVLDDVFIPNQGPHAVDANKMIENMKQYDIQVMSPGLVGDTYHTLDKASIRGLDRCIAEVDFIETYMQLFTRDAWTCYFKMLHYTGSAGWWYDLTFKDKCPDLRFGQDYLMRIWHMDKNMVKLPEIETNGLDLVKNWKVEDNPVENSKKADKYVICKKIGCRPKVEFYKRRREKIKKIACLPP